jgi:hypothetical protein
MAREEALEHADASVEEDAPQDPTLIAEAERQAWLVQTPEEELRCAGFPEEREAPQDQTMASAAERQAWLDMARAEELENADAPEQPENDDKGVEDGDADMSKEDRSVELENADAPEEEDVIVDTVPKKMRSMTKGEKLSRSEALSLASLRDSCTARAPSLATLEMNPLSVTGQAQAVPSDSQAAPQEDAEDAEDAFSDISSDSDLFHVEVEKVTMLEACVSNGMVFS